METTFKLNNFRSHWKTYKNNESIYKRLLLEMVSNVTQLPQVRTTIQVKSNKFSVCQVQFPAALLVSYFDQPPEGKTSLAEGQLRLNDPVKLKVISRIERNTSYK